jgi:glycosyltransferase involved in cell wall biosynthesis
MWPIAEKSRDSSLLIFLFYMVKPLVPRRIQIAVRRVLMEKKRKRFHTSWPIPFNEIERPIGWRGWPSGKKFALLLGHDIDTARGRNRCLSLMDEEKKLGFISSFNFVPKGYSVSEEIRHTILSAGFEIGVHGLKHDGKLFSSRRVFKARTPKINGYLKSWGSVGFYSPSMYRNAEWISELDIEYSCSTFDMDPFEPQPEGTGAIFPLMYRNAERKRSYVEIPYTMPQDHTLFVIFREKDISIWAKKLDWLAEKGGLVRLNTHPDYMTMGNSRGRFEEYPIAFYLEFLDLLKSKYAGQYWHVLPRELARFWREESWGQQIADESEGSTEKITESIHLARPKEKDAPRRVLIVLENHMFIHDPRVKNEALSLSDDGWEVHIICPAAENGTRPNAVRSSVSGTIYGNIQVHDYNISMGVQSHHSFLKEYVFSFYHIMRTSWTLWRKSRFSVIHLCNPPDYLFVIALVYKLLGCKVVFDHHDLFPEMILIRFKGMPRLIYYRVARLLEYLTFRTADIVISTNQSYKNLAAQRGHVKLERVFIVRNGPSLTRFVPEQPDFSLKHGYPFMASYAGIMNKEDGVIELINVIDHIVTDLNRKDIVFYLLGDGSMYDAVVKKVDRLGLTEFIRLPGLITDNKRFRKILSTSDVLLAPELSNPLNDKSTFIKIAEYMAIGKPIVAYALKETKHTAGDSALYAPSGDIKEYARLILSLLDDSQRSATMGKAGQERVTTKFSWENQRMNLKAAYDKAYELLKTEKPE